MTDTIDRLKAALADRYAIQEELGAGGMATVYLAEDVKHHRKVAVKVLRPELAAILGGERFLKEIEVTANLQHPHILQLYDSGEADSYLYYVMPYIEGESLREKLHRESQLSIDETLEITKVVASALDFAHKRDIIHRDIKPENILLQDGVALVADFGIAVAVKTAGGERLTETGLSLGTPSYMSPEQIAGQRDLDARSDVYSLACVTYEMLSGDPPFVASNAQAVIAKHIADSAPSIRLGKALAGDWSAVLAPLSEDERTSTQNDEFLSYLMSAAQAQAGKATEALNWLEHTVRDRGWIDYVFFTTHDTLLESLRNEPRFKDLMAYAREEYERVDVATDFTDEYG